MESSTINICIIHFNTPLLTECLIKSINKFTPNSKIYIFDNSDKQPFTYRQDNIVYLDNTKGQIIDFEQWLKKFPNRKKSNGKINLWGSAKHAYSVQKCIDMINDNFILLDSDILLKKDISGICHPDKIYTAEVITQPQSTIKRVVPYLCFINVNLMKKNNITYFNEKYMHGLYVTANGDLYDTGSWFFKNSENISHTEILCNDYIVHFKGGSWSSVHDKRFGKNITQEEWLSLNKKYYNDTFEMYKDEIIAISKKHGISLNLKNPKTIQEKIQWLKIYDTTPLKTKCSDKVLVHEYCKEKLGKDICIPIIKIYNNTKEINWDELPNSFVIKCNHGSGMNIIVKNKKELNKENAVRKLNNWMKIDFALSNGYEMQYHNIKRKIFVEEYKEDANQKSSLYDYKFWCFNGEPKFLTVNDGFGHGKMNFYDLNFDEISLQRTDFKRIEKNIEKPVNFELMKEYAKKLSEDFLFVRVDFYEVDNELYLGELTFTPGSGWFNYKSKEDDIRIGNMLILPKNNKVIYTCITNNYDKLIEPSSLIEGYDFVCYTDDMHTVSREWSIRPIPDNLKHLSPVKQQRYIKTHPHEFFQEYDISIWVDGNIGVISNPSSLINNYCIEIPKHPKRGCIYDEAKECILQKKDTKETISNQINRYKKEGFPKQYGLPQSNIIIRKHNDENCIKLMNDWWKEIEQGSHRDQLSFNYVLWKNPEIKVFYLDKNIYNSKYFHWNVKHGKEVKRTTPPAATVNLSKSKRQIERKRIKVESSWNPITVSPPKTAAQVTVPKLEPPKNNKNKTVHIKRLFY